MLWPPVQSGVGRNDLTLTILLSRVIFEQTNC